MPAYLFSLLLVLCCLTAAPIRSAAQSASENAEAKVYFEEGNRLYQAASEAQGSKRTSLLRQALESYVDSLRIVRSRNALFNAAIVLEELDRHAESFNYYGEYLQIEELPADDRQDAMARREALRPQVAVLQVTSDPPEAKLWVDRKDLAPLGETPNEVALTAGEHTVFVEKAGHLPADQSVIAERGKTAIVAIVLTPVTTEKPEPMPEPVDAATSKPRLRNAAIGTASAAVAVAATGLGLALRARTLRDENQAAAERYEMTGDPDDLAEAEALADRTDRFNIAADVMWGTSIALGISAIVLYTQHRKRQRRERVEVDLHIDRHGAFAAVRLPLRGAP